ncbi:MAG: hypothetical protein EBY28_15705, partial [Betaproteobacteria bacterium]|nr:hypothetical protein [Betaproteobacteria bacterium]
FAGSPGLTQLLPLRRFHSLAAVAAGLNSMTLWDFAADRAISLDFQSELQSMSRSATRITCARFDDARGLILAGTDDGSVFVRAVSRIAETNDLAITLARFCAPSVEALAPSRITTLWYDTRADALYQRVRTPG